MEFDARVLRAAGGWGRRARALAAGGWAAALPLALGFFSGPLLAAAPALRRPAPRNASLPPRSAGPGPAPCARAWHYALPAAGLRSTLVTQWDLVCSDHWKVPLEQTTYLLGWLCGCLLLGLACDRFGRRAGFVCSLVLAAPLGVGVALALDYVMLLVLRMLLGAALAGAFLALYVARLELCDPPHRLMVVMVANFFWVAGELLLPGLAVLCQEWRVLQGTVTLLLALLAVCASCPLFFPESPRWLLATRQLEKGRKVLRCLAEGNGVTLEDDFYSREHLFTELDSLSEGPPLPQYHSVCEIIDTRVIWKNSLILGFTALIGNGIRHCFTRNLAPYPPRFYFSYFLLAATEAVACLCLCLTVDRFGRRAMLLLCTILTGIASLLLLALTQYLLASVVLTLSVLGITTSHAVAMLSILFAGEVLPTVLRGSGLGLILAASFMGQATAPIMAISNSRGFFLHHVVFASFAILSVLSIMSLPEPKGKALPESLEDGERRRRPALFRASHRKDQLPLLLSHSQDDAQSYARLVTATKKLLGSTHRSPRLLPATPRAYGSCLGP